ncbi:hypothetical protein KO02_13780 [Sphingobacterium sp. ML3W]|nr:hypothetical protein KO02_13780 [Sphingobacterium sp. ML3W]
MRSYTRKETINSSTYNINLKNMDLKYFKNLIKKVESLGEEPEFYGKVDQSEIKQVESALDLKFDKELTSYLKEFGGAGIPDSLNTNGIIPQEALSDNLYTIYGATIYARDNHALPSNYLVLDAEFPDKCWVLECSALDSNPVFAYNCISPKTEGKIYNSFQEYLITEWEQFLEEYED